MDINENPEAASVFPAPKTNTPADDPWKRVGAGLNYANNVATTLRGLRSDLSQGGPAASPLAARPAGAAGAYQPTARTAGGLRLSDILARR
jgi:hypothetical protein